MAIKSTAVVSLNLWIWRIFGCWPVENGGRIDSILYNSYGIFLIITMYVLYVPTMMLSMLHLTKLEEIAACLFISLTFLSMIPKYWNILTKRNAIRELLRTLDSEEMVTQDDEAVIDIVNRNVKKGRFANLLLFNMANAALISYFVAPLADLSAKKLPFLAWYGFDHTRTPWYELLYTYQCIGVTFNCLINCAVDTLPSVIMCLLVGQLEVLAYKIEKIGNDVKSNRGIRNIDHEIITKSVDHHNFIARLTLDVQNIFGTAIFFQFLLSGIIICMTGFQLSLLSPLKDTLQCMMLMVYFATICVQIFLPCYFGNQIMHKSGLLAEAAFFSAWYDTKLKTQKNVVIFTERAKKPLKIYAGKMLELNLQTFTTIIHSSYTYYALLQTMQNTKN